jgi:MFS family permease
MALKCELLSPPRAPPDDLCSLRGSAVIAGAFFTFFFCSGLQYCFGLIYKALLADASLGGTHFATSWVLSIEYFFFLSSGVLAAPLISSRGPRAAALAGASLVSAGFAASSAVTNLALLYATYGALVGGGCGLLLTAASYTVTQHFVRRRALALGAALAGGGLGAIVLAPAIEAATSAAGWRGALRLLAALAACVLPVAALPFNSVAGGEAPPPAAAARGGGAGAEPPPAQLAEGAEPLLPPEGAEGDEPGGGGGGGAAATPPPPPPAAPSFAVAFSSAPFRWFALGCFLYTGVFFTVLENLAPFLTEAAPRGAGLSAGAAAALGSAQGAFNVVGRLAIGAAADRRGASKVALTQATTAAEAALLAGLLLAPRAPGYAPLFAAAFGFCAGSVVALQPAIVAELVPPGQLAHGLGLLYLLQSPAVLIVPSLAAAARDQLGGYAAVWAAVPAILAAAAALFDGGALARRLRGGAACGRRAAGGAEK